tara:strand:- start:2667 stop:3563 length:897 start_codon:yes stop_codon:yes gene_type:complete
MNKTQEPLLSVIIPCYNQGKYIDNTINSVLKQGYKNIEIIIVNDGSTDGLTNQKLQEIEHPKIMVFNIENKGSAGARNYGFMKAQGKYVQFIDSDDIILGEKFNSQISALEANTTLDFCYSKFQYCNNNLNIITVPFKFTYEFGKSAIESLLYNYERNFILVIGSSVFKKSLWAAGPPFDEKVKSKEDWIFWINIMNKDAKFQFIDEYFLLYRLHDANKTKNLNLTTSNFSKASYIIYEMLADKYKEKFAETTFVHLKTSINEMSNYKDFYNTLFNSYDYKIGRTFLAPFRKIKKWLL